MAQLTTQQISLTGVAISYTAAAAGGDTFANSGKTYLRVKNGGGASITVTVNSVAPCNYGFDHDAVVAVAAGAEKAIGPFDKVRFNNTDGNVAVTYSGVTTVTVAVVEMP